MTCGLPFTSFPGLTADIEKMKKLAEIKVKILNKIGLRERPFIRNPFADSISRIISKRALNDSELSHFKPEGSYYAEMEEFVSHSQIPENLTDPNIILFKVVRDVQGRKLEVVCADVLVKVKYRNRRKRNKRKKRMKEKNIVLTLSNIDSSGEVIEEVSSLSAKLRRTKWLKVPVPSTIVEEAMSRNDQNLYLRLDCSGCDNDVKLILISNRRKQRRKKRFNKWKSKNARTLRPKIRRKRKLNKTRPFLILHTKLKTFIRSKRDSPVCNSNSSCCMDNLEVNFESLQWNFIIAPLSFTTGICRGSCTGARRHCNESKMKPLRIIYFDTNHNIIVSTLPNMVVTECSCSVVR